MADLNATVQSKPRPNENMGSHNLWNHDHRESYAGGNKKANEKVGYNGAGNAGTQYNDVISRFGNLNMGQVTFSESRNDIPEQYPEDFQSNYPSFVSGQAQLAIPVYEYEKYQHMPPQIPASELGGIDNRQGRLTEEGRSSGGDPWRNAVADETLQGYSSVSNPSLHPSDAFRFGMSFGDISEQVPGSQGNQYHTANSHSARGGNRNLWYESLLKKDEGQGQMNSPPVEVPLHFEFLSSPSNQNAENVNAIPNSSPGRQNYAPYANSHQFYGQQVHQNMYIPEQHQTGFEYMQPNQRQPTYYNQAPNRYGKNSTSTMDYNVTQKQPQVFSSSVPPSQHFPGAMMDQHINDQFDSFSYQQGPKTLPQQVPKSTLPRQGSLNVNAPQYRANFPIQTGVRNSQLGSAKSLKHQKKKSFSGDKRHSDDKGSSLANHSSSKPRHKSHSPRMQSYRDSGAHGPGTTRRRTDLSESPATRLKFKEFYRQFRLKEKCSFEAAQQYAIECLQPEFVLDSHGKASEKCNPNSLPEKLHWKIYLEMADLAKRENRFTEARRLYRTVNKLQPYAPQGWLEYSKMEEECGRLPYSQKILEEGLTFCNFSEPLLIKAIKLEERMGNLGAARALLGRLRNVNVEKAWKTILEGALLEARAGNVLVARKVFKYLMRNVPWYGPIYYEAAKFEEKNEEFQRAIAIVEEGLTEIPRYGPLWFNAFRLHENIERIRADRNNASTLVSEQGNLSYRKIQILATGSNQYQDPDRLLFDYFGIPNNVFPSVPKTIDLLNTRGALQRAMNCISKELVWKVHFEAAQVAERGGEPNWIERARAAYVQSVLRCPNNLRWKVWLAGVRTELTYADSMGDSSTSRSSGMIKAKQLLEQALLDVPDKSRAQVLLECSRVEEYFGNVKTSRAILSRARKETKHEWKVFLESVMLEVRCGNRERALEEAKSALEIHCGTGRLWAIRVQLTHIHGPDQQRLVFREALKQVPKSGEVWCEGARVHLHPLSPHFDLETASRYLDFGIQFTPQYGDSFVEALRFHILLYDQQTNFKTTDKDFKQTLEKKLDTSALEQRCVNADPNYGALWFHCKRGPFDTARQVLRTAKTLLIAEIGRFRNVYREAYLEQQDMKAQNSLIVKDNTNTISEKKSEENLRTTPALEQAENTWIWDRLNAMPDNLASDQLHSFADFSTGLCSVNWIRERVALLNSTEKRKILFGSDTIVP
mmetsp:Transcript_11868/g.13801  ORF Transcript_11868/g.13801 Transcript_11868/m.13801 type:complete len:1213 (-) Transcript_11868:1358-4996(-)